MSRVSITTPIIVAKYPKISKPDTYGDKADGKFKTDGIFTADAWAKFKKLVEAEAKEEYGQRKVVFNVKDEEGGGHFIRFASKYKPAIFDSKNNELPVEAVIGGGSRIRVIAGLNFYDKTQKTVKVSFYLNEVQVIELKEYKPGDGPRKSNFDEVEDGYVADTDNTSEGEEGEDEADGSEDDKLDEL